MATKIKPQAKFALIFIGALVFVFGVRALMQHGVIPTPGLLKSVVASKVELPKQEDAQVQGVAAWTSWPSNTPAHVASNLFPVDGWEWNGQSAVHLAAGGAETMRGSLMEKYGVNYRFKRTDSNVQMKADILACAKQLKDGEKTCSNGAAALMIMGDGAGQWLADLNPQLAKLGKEYQLKIVGTVGRSNGEDALLGPAEWKTNPKSMLGKTIVGVRLDGDWNIALNFMGANNLKNNPDPTTYDPDAVNWISAPDDDYIKAVTEVYIPNKCEQRKEVKDGRPTGKMVQVCPDGVVTWTPGDEQAVHGRPGTFKIASSREYSAQMPTTLMVIGKYAQDNRATIEGFLAATWQSADQIKAYDIALRKAAEISAKVYNDQTGEYWYKYFKGVTDKNTGVQLGGSAVFNLEDNLRYFGISSGYNNNMRATYETFARICTEQYPAMFKENPIPAYKDAVDVSYITGAQARLNSEGVSGATGETVDYAAASRGEVVGREAVYINFATGSDVILPDGLRELGKLKDALAVNQSLALQLDGYTDNAGSDTVNIPLSERRAAAVKAYLQRMAPRTFPESRFRGVAGHGSQNPIADNTTPNGKAKNRRVEVLQIG
jgi:outer membrane protein OmpA-like peptidoglycan-associated protein